jgi:hypothetical protein
MKHLMNIVSDGAGLSQYQCWCGWLGDRYFEDSVLATAAAAEQAEHHKAGLTEVAKRNPLRIRKARR